MIELVGPPSHVNMLMSQSREGRIWVSAFAANRGRSSMPMAFVWLCAISNVSARSWLPAVVLKRNDSFPTPGQDQMFVLLRFGVVGPPVQPLARSRAIAARWLKPHRAKNGR